MELGEGSSSSNNINSNIHQRVLVLRDVALGLNKSSEINSVLIPASYDCAVDSMVALHEECTHATSLNRNRNVGRFLRKYKGTVEALSKLRLTVDDFRVMNIIGRGHFGEVQVVREKSTGEVYAMKIMKKAHILQQPDAAFFSEERDIMARATSPWLTSLHYAFQDATSLYLVMDYHPGGDLLTVMERKDGGMTEEETRFYLSEIAAGLNDLHHLGFVHRDVKPENVLISRSGHIRLVDFGSAARLREDGIVVESRLPVGTPEYIAPEVLTSLDKSAEYGVCCDWWSLGIIAYELLYVSTPFEGETTTKTYGNIMNYKSSLAFSEEVTTSGEVQSLIKSLLTDPTERLSFNDLKIHPFFSSVNWEHLLSALPPYIPSVSSPDDTSNFDVFEPKKDDLLPTDVKSQTEFSGKSLPFVGFTFTRYDHTQFEFTDSSSHPNKLMSSVSGTSDDNSSTKWSLERAQTELREVKERNSCLEKECVVYQSQLKEFNQKFERERIDRRQSDAKALKLLEEVKVHNETIRELRKEEEGAKEAELKCVVSQLEQDRIVASNKARRLQTEVSSAVRERDMAVKVALELKTKLKAVKENSKKDIALLQAKLEQVSKESVSQSTDIHEKLTEAFEHHTVVSKKLKAAENTNRKNKLKIGQLERDVSSKMEEVQSLNRKLEATKLEASEHAQDMEKTVESLRMKNKVAQQERDDFNHRHEELLAQLTKANNLKDQFENGGKETMKEVEKLHDEIKQLQQSAETLTSEKVKLAKTHTECLDTIQKQKEDMARLHRTEQELEQKLSSNHKGESSPLTMQTRLNRQQAERVTGLETEKQKLTKEMASINSELKSKTVLANVRQKQLDDTKSKHEKVSSSLQEEVRSLQSKLSEERDMAIKQGERLSQVRASKRGIDLENSELKLSLRKAESEKDRLLKQYEAKRKEAEEGKELNKKLSDLERELASKSETYEALSQEVDNLRSEKEKYVSDKKQTEIRLKTANDKLAAQELKSSLLQRKLKLLEDELADNKAAMEEMTAAESRWKSLKTTLTSDLETAESRLDKTTASINREKSARTSAEKKCEKAVKKLEQALSSHNEELQGLREQLETQLDLNSKCNCRVLQLEKELKLKELSLKEGQKDLETEKAFSSKIYDDLFSLHRDHGKLKAAYMKLCKEKEQHERDLSVTTAVRDRVLDEQRTSAQAHQEQETRMQSTIQQQTKLIDYLQGVGTSPSSKGFGRFTKGLKFGRKTRDPAKEIAEWNKLKGLARKPIKSADVSQASTSLSSNESSQFCVSLSLSSISSAEFNHSEIPPVMPSVPKPSKKRKQTQNEAESDSFKVEQSTLLKFPVMTVFTGKKKGSKKSPKNDVQMSTLQSSSSTLTSPVEENGREEVSADLQTAIKKLRGAQHNIPHKFRLQKTGLLRAYKCAACKEQIKHLHRYTKCTYCNLVCHPSCTDDLPNHCGLPSELADPNLSQSISASKKQHTVQSSSKSDTSKKNPQKSGNSDRNQEQGGDAPIVMSTNEWFTSLEGGMFSSTPALIIPKTGIIKIERITKLRGGLNTTGWLLLDRTSLSFYDRDPRGITRSPVCLLNFTSPDCIYETVPSISVERFVRSRESITQTFGIRKYTKSNLGEELFIFRTDSLQSKIEWLETIGTVLSQLSSVTEQLVYGDAGLSPESEVKDKSMSRKRSLKSVSIIPIVKTPRQSLDTEDKGDGSFQTGDLDLSIRSSMLGDSVISDNASVI